MNKPKGSPSGPAPSGENPTTKRSALIVSVVSAFTHTVMASAVNVALPAIGDDLHMDAVALSWVATSYVLAAAVMLLPAGRIADINGRKKIWISGMVIFTLSSLAISLAPSPVWLITGRVVQGVGSAMIFATGMAILSSVFPPGERGKALGLNVAAVYLGLSAGPFIGGVLTQQLSWRAVFIMVLPLGLIAIALAATKLKGEWADARGEKLDKTGALLYAGMLVCFVLAMGKLTSITGLALMLLSLAGLGAFVYWEKRAAQPVLDLELFLSNRVFAFSCVAALIQYSATFAVTFLMSIYLQHIFEMTPQKAGMVLVTAPAVMALVSPLAGRISDRIEPRIVASLGMFVTALGLAVLSLLDPQSSLSLVLTGLAVMGLGIALFSSPNMNAILSSVEKRHYGLASGTVGIMRLIGQMSSMGLATFVFALYLGPVAITKQVHGDLAQASRVAFIIFIVLCLLGTWASLVRGDLKLNQAEPPEA